MITHTGRNKLNHTGVPLGGYRDRDGGFLP